VTPFALVDLPSNRLSLGPLVAVIILGALGTGIARSIQATMNGRVGAPRAAIVGYLVPIVAVVLGVVFRDETMQPTEIAGFAAVLFSAYLVTRAVRTTPPALSTSVEDERFG
jgi:drug/metabolite transporter (DMT)-like permease